MTPTPANPNITPERYSPKWFRILEVLPGLIMWFALLGPFILSIFWPLWVTIFVILFDVYWLQKSLDTARNLFYGYRRFQANLDRDWQEQLDKSLLHRTGPDDTDIIDWRDVYQAVIFPTYKEPKSVLAASIASVADADYPKERKILVLATEGRDADNIRHIAKELEEQFKDSFHLFIVTEHPDGIVGEVKGKGANATWAAKELVAQVKKQHIPLESIIVSTADADTRFNKQYFKCLTYMYATTPDRIHCSYQPVATFLNNVWEAPMISRVLAFQTTFWQMVESVRDYRMITFSTHAMSLKTLDDMDYWCTSIVNEDSRQFFRAYFRYEGNFRAIPLFMPVYMDAVHVSSFRATLHNLYLQQQRWAYGAEHTPYVIMESLHHPKIPLLNRLSLIWRQVNGHFSWATQAFFITVVGYLPVYLNSTFNEQVIASNFPYVTKMLLTITWLGLFVAGFICLKMLPARKKSIGSLLKLSTFILQWLLVPITSVFFGALVSIDSQTRLMLGKYLGFRVTEKEAI